MEKKVYGHPSGAFVETPFIMEGEVKGLQELRNHAKGDLCRCHYALGFKPATCLECGKPTRDGRLEAEIKRLNRVGWGIVQKVTYVNELFVVDSDGNFLSKTKFNSVNNLNHTALVKKAMVEKGWHFVVYYTPGDIITELYRARGEIFESIAPLDQEGLAVMRCVEKAIGGNDGQY